MKILVRVDSSIEIGYGHVMRCLTIASYLEKLGHELIFFTKPAEGSLEDLIQNKGFEVVLLDSDLSQINEKGDWLIIDSYTLDLAWEAEAKKINPNILIIDDLNRKHNCSILVDSTLGKTKESYSELTQPIQLFVGGHFPILRSEFIALREKAWAKRFNFEKVKNILVNIGGTDNLNLTLKIVQLLKESREFDVTIILSNKSNDYLSVKDICDQFSHLILYSFVENMHELMFDADLAIGAAGTSSYERAVIGLPSIMIQTADNQKYNIQAFKDAGVALTIAPSELNKITELIVDISSKNTYDNLVKNSFNLIKPLGIFSALEAIHGQTIYSLDTASLVDVDQVYSWQSFPGARKYSRDETVPIYENHVNWFESSLSNSNRVMFILKLFDISLGFVKVDLSEDTNEVSIIISHGHYGQGLGKVALNLLRGKMKKIDLHAYIENENSASLKIFKSCGYIKLKENWYINKG